MAMQPYFGRFVRSPIFAISLLAAQSFVPANARADDGADATAFVRDFSDRGYTMMALPLDARVESLRGLVLEVLEVETIGRFTLGRGGLDADEDARRQFHQAYEDYVVRMIVQKLMDYRGETMKVGKARPGGGKDQLVEAIVEREMGPSIRIEWRVRHGEKGWRVVDLVFEGLSMAATQRDEFASLLRKGGGLPALAAVLRQWTQEL